MRPAVKAQMLADSLKDLIRSYLRTSNIAPSKLAQIANISTQMTHRVNAPEWNPSLRTLDRLYQALPENWQAKFDERYAIQGPTEIRLPIEWASDHFGVASSVEALHDAAKDGIERAIEVAQKSTERFLLYKFENSDFLCVYMGSQAHKWRDKAIEVGALLSERTNKIMFEF